jgi:hypothetical protein
MMVVRNLHDKKLREYDVCTSRLRASVDRLIRSIGFNRFLDLCVSIPQTFQIQYSTYTPHSCCTLRSNDSTRKFNTVYSTRREAEIFSRYNYLYNVQHTTYSTV